ncbi:D19L3-like protein [Mya arenaria]|uniref:D19L3-like protein n=1 Tax=Mya arenaria TaxID=6604 RepID=A0ABY7EGE7_MYAAR|nr:D19L3-like protein [Mya arenaria]
MTDIRRRKGGRHKPSSHQRNGFAKGAATQKEAFTIFGWSVQQFLLNCLGVLLCLYIGFKHSWYMRQINENNLWFSNLKEVEREISFRTESGLYYSYYKQMVNAPSITQGLYALTHDNMTEHPATINVLERMNIYQEVILSILYRILPVKNILEPVYFYINTVFALHGMLFNQFVMLLQSLALFGVWILDLVPANKVRMILLFNAVSLLSVCVLQSVNTMILGSLVMSFIPATFLLMYFKGDSLTPCSIPARISKVAFYSITSIILMDFDSRLYLCIEAFGFLQLDTFERMSKLLVFPIYLVTHLTLLAVNHSHEVGLKDHPSPRHSHLLSSRPDLAFHAIQAMFFGALGMSTLRMKYLWTPYMCILAGFGVGDYRAWKNVLARLRINQDTVVQIARHLTTIAVLALLFAIALPPALKGLEDLKEFWDPDTVELMEWIKKSTPPTAALSGSMQLMAGVKLCTGRPITNHPHYEDKILRIKTKELYQYYAKRDPADVHALMKKYKTDYIILEDSICLAPSRGGCRLPDILDVDNGVIPDSGISEPGLVKSNIPRFCDEVRRQTPEYAKYFKHVFTNKTFRIYKIVLISFVQ